MVYGANTIEKELETYISLEIAAGLLETSRQALWYKIKVGAITLYKIGKSNVLHREEIEAYKQSKNKGKGTKIIKQVKNYVGIDEAAKILEITPAGVWNAIRRTKMVLYRTGNINALSIKDVEKFKTDPVRLLKRGKKSAIIVPEKPEKIKKIRKV